MKVKITQQAKQAINDMPFNTTVKKNAIKIWAGLYMKSFLKNSVGYFPVPSTYLQSINKRYSTIINYFIEKELIKVFLKPNIDENDIFNTIYTKSYNVDKGICMKYKFLVDFTNAEEIEVDMLTNRQTKWYSLLENSLLETGYEPNITRDNYGRRCFHPAIKEYRTDFRGWTVIDSVCSQPRLLYLYLKDKGIKDESFNDIFENNKDFYKEVAYTLDLENGRNDAKDLFMEWVNGNGYVKNYKIHMLFPIVSKFLKSIKSNNYKDSGSLLQRIESKIWIDDIMNHIPVDFAIPIHDAVILKDEDGDRVLTWLKNKYPDLRFEKGIVKPKKI